MSVSESIDTNVVLENANEIKRISKKMTNIYDDINGLKKSIKIAWTGSGSEMYLKKLNTLLNYYDDIAQELKNASKYLNLYLEDRNKLENSLKF